MSNVVRYWLRHRGKTPIILYFILYIEEYNNGLILAKPTHKMHIFVEVSSTSGYGTFWNNEMLSITRNHECPPLYFIAWTTLTVHQICYSYNIFIYVQMRIHFRKA